MSGNKINWNARLMELGQLLGQWIEKGVSEAKIKAAEEMAIKAENEVKLAARILADERVRQWALEFGVSVRWPEDFAPTQGKDPRSAPLDQSPCIDFGRVQAKVPRFVVLPADQAQLSATLLLLSHLKIPIKIRAGGHSNGAQTLMGEEGAVIDMRHLNRIVSDHPTENLIRVEGGARWVDVIRHLHAQNRRPLTMTGYWQTTVAGTLSVGGFGDTTHINGPQTSSITAMTVMTLDGQRHEVTSGHPLFDYVLAGRGQLAVIADATIKTSPGPWVAHVALLEWARVEDLIEDAAKIIEQKRFSPFNVRYFWRQDAPFLGGACFLDEEPNLEGLKAKLVGINRDVDLFAAGMEASAPGFGARNHWPCLEFVLPLPQGLEVWQEFHRDIKQSLLDLALEDGSPIVIMHTTPTLPLAPFPDSPFCLVFALRPKLQGFQVPANIGFLNRWRQRILDAGGKIYLMSIEDGDLKLAQQFGPAYARFVELKKEFDPDFLLNPGLLR